MFVEYTGPTKELDTWPFIIFGNEISVVFNVLGLSFNEIVEFIQ